MRTFAQGTTPSTRRTVFRQQRRVVAYTCAVAGPAIIASSKVLFLDEPGDMPFLLFFAQIVLAGAIGGFLPALAASAVSGLFVVLLLLPPLGSLAIDDRDTLRTATFLTEAVVVSIVLGLIHRSWTDARDVLSATRAASDRVRQAWGERTRLLAEASSEVRDPVRRIVSQIELAKRQLGSDEDGAALSSRLDAALDAARSLDKVADRLLEVARSQGVVRAAPDAAIDLARLMREVAAQYATDPRGPRVELEVPPGGVLVRGSETALARVLRSLIDNGLLYDRARWILLELTVDQSHATVRVRDCGPGIPDAERRQVFEPFFRASNAHGTGSGLSLAVSRQILEQFHGRIWIDESGTDGTTVAFSLPRVR